MIRASSGTEALRYLLQDEFAVILLDVDMPFMNGFETAELIRRRDKSRHTPIIFLTAVNKTEEHIFKGYALGAVDYLTKPLIPEILRPKVMAFVELHKRRREREQFIAAESARREAEAAQHRSAFLADASTRLASTLDYEKTLASVARIPVPELGDWCFVVTSGDENTLASSAVFHADPQKRELAQTLFSHDAATRPPLPAVMDVFRTGSPILLHDISSETLDVMIPVTEHRVILRSLGCQSALLLPLFTRQVITGVLGIVAGLQGRYSAPELSLAEDLARRVSLTLENVQLLREAQNANRAKDEFLATLSHEIRTPLNAILGWIEVLRRKRVDEVTSVRAMEAIHRNAKVQADLIEDMLDVSRIITGRLRLEFRLVEIETAIEAALDAVRPAAEAKGVRLECTVEPVGARISGDAHRLQQIVWNLLSNAVKFTPLGGHVRVSLHRDDLNLRLTVSDSGRGIDPQFLPFVFERFRQAEAATSRKYGGLGLGLSIARHLVELHGGTIEAASEGEGKGATFTVSLPVREICPAGFTANAG
jgi:signal transduction histidine kinase